MITDDILKDSIPFFRYIRYEKGEKIYDKPSDSQKFFGLIKGKIAIRKSLNSIEEGKKNVLVEGFVSSKI